MAEANTPVETEGKSIKEAGKDFFNSIKTPVFWLAIGYGICKFMDRKKKI